MQEKTRFSFVLRNREKRVLCVTFHHAVPLRVALCRGISRSMPRALAELQKRFNLNGKAEDHPDGSAPAPPSLSRMNALLRSRRDKRCLANRMAADLADALLRDACGSEEPTTAQRLLANHAADASIMTSVIASAVMQRGSPFVDEEQLIVVPAFRDWIQAQNMLTKTIDKLGLRRPDAKSLPTIAEFVEQRTRAKTTSQTSQNPVQSTESDEPGGE
jgi:hypothetical protein